jgi:hypothetical protein
MPESLPNCDVIMAIIFAVVVFRVRAGIDQHAAAASPGTDEVALPDESL